MSVGGGAGGIDAKKLSVLNTQGKIKIATVD
jgi:hypothetical protein